MTKQYIKLSDGRKLRIEANWNVLTEFLDRTDQEYDDFIKRADRLTAAHMRLIAYCAAKEGERQDGKQLDLSELDFGALCTIPTMNEFGLKFGRMVTGDKSEDPEGQKKKTVPKEKVRTRPVMSSIKRIIRR